MMYFVISSAASCISCFLLVVLYACICVRVRVCSLRSRDVVPFLQPYLSSTKSMSRTEFVLLFGCAGSCAQKKYLPVDVYVLL